MKEPKLTHIQKRNGVYYFRRKIPLDLKTYYGKAEITFSLETKERKEAEPKARKCDMHYDNEFEAKRKVSNSKTKRLSSYVVIIKYQWKNYPTLDIFRATKAIPVVDIACLLMAIVLIAKSF